MANYPPYGYNTPQMAQGQPMMGPQGQPGYIPQQMQQMPQQHQQIATNMAQQRGTTPEAIAQQMGIPFRR